MPAFTHDGVAIAFLDEGEPIVLVAKAPRRDCFEEATNICRHSAASYANKLTS